MTTLSNRSSYPPEPNPWLDLMEKNAVDNGIATFIHWEKHGIASVPIESDWTWMQEAE